tara:strand:- start:943 stop:1323 length:381 start_codon:yes stop_codon:yes gene_type:complete
MRYKIYCTIINSLVFGLIILTTNSCVFYSFANKSTIESTSLFVPLKAELKTECRNTLISENCTKRSVITGLPRSNTKIFIKGNTNRKGIDVSDTCIYGVAAIDVFYRVTAILPRPKITVICALPES